MLPPWLRKMQAIRWGGLWNRFALVAMAVNWQPVWVSPAGLRVKHCGQPASALNAWLKDRGHTANQEDIAALEQVRSSLPRISTAALQTGMTSAQPPGNMGGLAGEKGDTAQGTGSCHYCSMSCRPAGKKSAGDLTRARWRVCAQIVDTCCPPLMANSRQPFARQRWIPQALCLQQRGAGLNFVSLLFIKGNRWNRWNNRIFTGLNLFHLLK